MRRLLLAALVVLAAAAPAEAARQTFGSDLGQPADLSDSNPRDWAAWPAALAPASGEVATVALRGTIAAPAGLPPGFVFRILVLRPRDNGKVEVIAASTDLAPRLTNLDPATVTTIDLQQFPERMCALAGDVVAFATSGGYDAGSYPGGVPVRMFASAPGRGYGVFKEPAGAGALMLGDEETPARVDGADALMRITVGTGEDARPTCRVSDGDPSLPPGGAGAVELVPQATTRVRRRRARISVRCPGTAACAGRLRLSRAARSYGSSAFTVGTGETRRVAVRLNRAGRRALGRADGKLTVKVTATAGGQTVSGRTVLRR